MTCAEQVPGMLEMRKSYGITALKPEGNRHLGRLGGYCKVILKQI